MHRYFSIDSASKAVLKRANSPIWENDMINGYRVYDADAHVNAAPQMWEDMPAEFAARRPRPALIHDARNWRRLPPGG